jgi:uncharacterized membrane protein (UPF0136 family)
MGKIYFALWLDLHLHSRPMRASLVLWIYIVLLVVGGLIGFLKAGSKVSLIMSVVFAALLSLCATRVIFQPYVADILLAALLVVFGMRLAKTKKFMPSGLMLILTVAALALRHIQF